MAKNIVLPGEPICKEEEYLAHKNVYVDIDGTIRATITGEVVFDNINRRISIKPVKELKIPKSSDIVIGYVSSMKDDIALLEIFGYDLSKTFKHTFTGVLHIFQVSETKGDNLYNHIRLGDIVKAKVLNSYIPLLITVKEPKLGVILAFCSRCGNQLYYENNHLICPICNNIENRKISIDYFLVRGKKSVKT